MLPIIAWSLALSVATPPPPGPCDLVDRATASALLGAPVTSMDPSGPERDEDSGAMRTTCTYKATALLIVLRLDFPSAAAARDSTAAQLAPEKLAGESATMKEVSGLGDKAYLVNTPVAVQYIVVKGSSVLSLILGGTANPPATYEAQLRAATTTATAKLP